MKHTAVDYIFHTFYNEDNISDYVLRIFEQAKEMEKQQLEKLKDFDTWKEWKNS